MKTTTLYTVYLAYTTIHQTKNMPRFDYYDNICYPNKSDAIKRERQLIQDFRKYAKVMYSKIDEV